jgi:2-oxoisovalerate dehydrogenase E1 component alpha subunit
MVTSITPASWSQVPGTPASSAAAAVSTPHTGVLEVQREDGSLDPLHDPHVETDTVIALYRHMVLVRLLDERMVLLQRQGRIGFHIGSLGEEAAILGSAAALRENDWLFPCYREFGAALWRGMTLESYMHNMFGNSLDAAKGRQMPDHYTCRAAKFGSISSPIGTQITQGVGFAWAAKMKKDPLATLVYFGEGATSSNEFHNGMNFAGVFKTPTVFFCRNNGWAISVPAERQTASASFAEKGIAYGIPSVQCDGNDLFAVMKVTRDAILRAAAGEGPTLIEALTYRISGHSTSDDPKAYRKDDVVDTWRKKDPLVRLRKYLDSAGLWSDTQERDLEAKIDVDLKAAIAKAEAAALPNLESMFEDVYATVPWHLNEQRAELLAGPRAKGHGQH